jgi:hypothetical protein
VLVTAKVLNLASFAAPIASVLSSTTRHSSG